MKKLILYIACIFAITPLSAQVPADIDTVRYCWHFGVAPNDPGCLYYKGSEVATLSDLIDSILAYQTDPTTSVHWDSVTNKPPFLHDSLAENQIVYGAPDGSMEQSPDLTYTGPELRLKNADQYLDSGAFTITHPTSGTAETALQINKSDGSNAFRIYTTAGGVTRMVLRKSADDGDWVRFDQFGDSWIMSSDGSPNLGIQTTSPQRALHIDGDLRVENLLDANSAHLVGAQADGDITKVEIGDNLSFSNDTLHAEDRSETLNKSGTYTIDLDNRPYVWSNFSFSSAPPTVTYQNPVNKSGTVGVYNLRLENTSGSDIDVSLSGFTFYAEDGSTITDVTVPANKARIVTFAVEADNNTEAFTMEQ